MNEARLVELEVKLAYQEDLVQALNTIVSDQQKQISQLEETCKFLNGRIKNMAESEGINQGLEIPPHY